VIEVSGAQRGERDQKQPGRAKSHGIF